MRKARMFAAQVAVLCASLVVAAGVGAAALQLSSLIPEYPRSELVEYEDEKEIKTHEIIMGTLKKSGGIVEPEASEFVVGRRIASTWYIPNEQRTRLVKNFFRDRLAEKGEIVFECSGYDCGSSNYWANNVFDRSILYGPEQNQHYFLTRIDDEHTYYVATYVALRGTRKLYAHADVIISEREQEVLSGAGIVEGLQSKGRVVIDAGAIDESVDNVVEAMRLAPSMRIAVVSHLGRERGESVPQTIARSEEIAKAFVDSLIERGVNQTRVQAYGVGPLSPLDRDIVERLELVLISNDAAS